MVRLRSILETEAFYKVGSPLAIALGRDVSGLPVVADLSSMPHLLIAGTTGSGKSVCIAAITACLVMNNTPSDMRLVMIDPKMVEFIDALPESAVGKVLSSGMLAQGEIVRKFEDGFQGQAVLGGIGIIPGAMLGAIIMGVVEVLNKTGDRPFAEADQDLLSILAFMPRLRWTIWPACQSEATDKRIERPLV
jgi:hypothetical protein